MTADDAPDATGEGNGKGDAPSAAAGEGDDRPFDLLTAAEIRDGRATAAYLLRTEAVLDHAGANPRVVAEVSAPAGWHVLAGLTDVANLLADAPVDVDAPPAGTVVSEGPVLRIEGPYRAFARYEQSVLGFLAHASGVASAALRVRAAAGERTLLSFGTRRQHPALGAMVERSAYLGGADGVGNVAGAEVAGLEAGGTMPHALVVALGDPETAWAAYHGALDPGVPRTLLCDTFGDEADEAVRAAGLLGDALDGVRLDTPASRRGDMRAIVEEVRWELDARGHGDVDVLVSGGLDADAVARLRDVADGFGVGGAIANADPLDLSMNLVEVDGDPRAKRGVRGGAKDVYRDPETYETRAVPHGTDATGDPLFSPLVRDGAVVADVELDAARGRALAGLDALRERDVRLW